MSDIKMRPAPFLSNSNQLGLGVGLVASKFWDRLFALIDQSVPSEKYHG